MACVRIGIDLMGGDHSPFVIWEAVNQVLDTRPDISSVSFVAFASSDRSDSQLDFSFSHAKHEVLFAENFVSMEDTPLAALRKKSSSMAMGLDYLRDGRIDAFVSTGNTAALVTLSRLKIPAFSSCKPALLVRIPTLSGFAVILDVGANVSVKPEDMLGFARMGAAYKRCFGVSHAPTIGLLNIGSEERKGTEAHRQTFRLLREEYKEAFLGNIESGDIFSGHIDVVVTDGFTGNIFLKTAEGLFAFLRRILGDKLENAIKREFDYSIYPGSMICGLSKLVIKCHGKSDGSTLSQGISGAIDLAQSDVCQHIFSSL